MPTVLVTGANRGIGLEFARQYAADGWRVLATARHPGGADALRATGAETFSLDMRDFAAVETFAARLATRPVDLFIANAGMTAGRRIDSAAEATAWQEVHAVNAVAPTLLARGLFPLVLATRGKMVAISSRMGSIADSSGDYVGYRASKAALNAAWSALSREWRETAVTLALLHPGWVQTDMGGPNAPLRESESVAGMRQVIDRLRPQDSGAFLDYRGETIPW